MRDIEKCYTRIMARSSETKEGCLVSMYASGSHGYPQAWDGESVVLVHRIVWEFHNGQVPKDMTVDHMCHNRRCIKIKHLRLLSNSENATDNGQTKTNLTIDRLCRKKLHLMVKGNNPPYCRECKQEYRRNRRRQGLE